MLEYIFKSILITSLLGSFLAILLTTVKPFTKKYFSGNWHYYIWLTVLFVMILPVRFVLPEQSITNQETVIANETVNVAETEIENVTGEDYYITDDAVKQPEVEYNDSSKISITFLPIIWIAIATLYFVTKVIEYILFVINNHKYSMVVPCPELAKYTDRKISVRVSNKISSPLMLGFFKPVILLPDKVLTDEQLNNVLAHEITHFKRGDILYKWFATVVKCIHWFNPIVYYVVKQINIECEISCDLSVVKYMSREQEINYVDTILALLSDRASGSVSLTTGMTGDKKTLQRRFEMIKNKSVISKKTVIISAILAGLLFSAIVFASGIISGKLIKFNENLLAINTDEVNGERTNFLVIGTDEQGRADSVIILSDNGEMLSLLSIPRNVMYDGKSMSDIISEDNGDQKAVDAVKDKLYIPIQYYAKVNLTAVKDLVNAVGGIEINVPMDMEYDDPYKDLHIKLKEGRHTLNGERLCELLQFRRSNDGTGYAEGDLTRISVAQNFITEFINQKLTKGNINLAPEIYNILAENISTNYPAKNLVSDINKIKNNKIELYTLPGTVKVSDNGINVYSVNYLKSKTILNSFRGNYISMERFKEHIISLEEKVNNLFTNNFEDTVIGYVSGAEVVKYKGPNNTFADVCKQLESYCSPNVAEKLIQNAGFKNINGNIGLISADGEVLFSEFNEADMELMKTENSSFVIKVNRHVPERKMSKDFIYTFETNDDGSLIITDLA